MPQPRTAWALVAALFLATLALVSPTSVVLGAVPTPALCPDGMPTMWKDDVHPPNSVRVLRATGPNKGRVETVNIWKYVGHVLRAEYSTGGSKPYPWMHIGALTVRQYVWFYAKMLRGGKVTYSTDPENPEAPMKTECYDVKDTTADQLYRPEKWDSTTGTWKPANVPTGVNLQAMRETWHLSLRKWQPDKNQSRLFLTGYRSGMKKPCGMDSTGFKIYQKSLRDCGNKNLTFEETLRRYFEANMLVVDNRSSDMVDDSSDWRGEVGLVSAGSSGTDVRVFKSTSDSFASAGAPTNFPGVTFSSIIGQGVGNVDRPAVDGANDSRMLADLVMLVNGGSRQILVAKATGSGFAAPTAVDAPAGSDPRLLVADFNGDMLTDAGVMVTVDGTRKLIVRRTLATGGFGDPTEWWSAPVDSTVDLEMAGDVNGDGKADLVMHTAGHDYLAATSRATCANFGAYGPCPADATGASGLGSATRWFSAAGWTSAKSVMGDYDRDGRDDVVVVLPNGGGFKVVALRAIKGEAAFADPLQLVTGAAAFDNVKTVAFNANPDGMADLALVDNQGGNARLSWLRTIERSVSPASMTPAGGSPLDTTVPWAAARPF